MILCSLIPFIDCRDFLSVITGFVDKGISERLYSVKNGHLETGGLFGLLLVEPRLVNGYVI